MSLLGRVSRIDSIGELEHAARLRYYDGLSLALSESHNSTGAVYLLGYVAEMLLKTAYYRVRGMGPTDDTWPLLRGMNDQAALVRFDWQSGRTRHNLEDLAGLLVEVRRNCGPEIDPYFASTLQGHAKVVALHWNERLRYKSVLALEDEVVDVIESIDWLVANYEALWR